MDSYRSSFSNNNLQCIVAWLPERRSIKGVVHVDGKPAHRADESNAGQTDPSAEATGNVWSGLLNRCFLKTQYLQACNNTEPSKREYEQSFLRQTKT